MCQTDNYCSVYNSFCYIIIIILCVIVSLFSVMEQIYIYIYILIQRDLQNMQTAEGTGRESSFLKHKVYRT